jgi:hypothetical protein
MITRRFSFALASLAAASVLTGAVTAADQSFERFAALETRRTGGPHPFRVTTDKYATFWGIISGCIRAEIARRPA